MPMTTKQTSATLGGGVSGAAFGVVVLEIAKVVGVVAATAPILPAIAFGAVIGAAIGWLLTS